MPLLLLLLLLLLAHAWQDALVLWLLRAFR
jgi:hypothetical protein